MLMNRSRHRSRSLVKNRLLSKTRARVLDSLFLALALSAPLRAEAAAPKPVREEALTDLDKGVGPEDSTDRAQRPWADGVSEDHQKKARAGFQEANALLRDSAFTMAAQKYGEALAEWDHPGIHFNMALALINLDRPLEVREHLRKATAYGPAPLEQTKFDHALSYLKLIEQQLAALSVRCDIPDAIVRLDDRELFRAPGSFTGFVRPGEHVVRATKPGFEPTVYQRTLIPGRETRLRLGLYTQSELTQKRWPTWFPTLVAGGGAAIAATGIVLLVQANSRLKQFDRELSSRSECSNGCVPDSSLAALRDSGTTYRTVGTVLTSSGAAIFTGGVALMIINVVAARRIAPEERDRRAGFWASVSPGYAGVGARF